MGLLDRAGGAKAKTAELETEEVLSLLKNWQRAKIS